ncbi:hypothetical protein IAD21_03831 [Abditibacteriota bacterium]|nr:hypothetical protein IAD21_03831 [Abditibacteriota bacterium]
MSEGLKITLSITPSNKFLVSPAKTELKKVKDGPKMIENPWKINLKLTRVILTKTFLPTHHSMLKLALLFLNSCARVPI